LKRNDFLLKAIAMTAISRPTITAPPIPAVSPMMMFWCTQCPDTGR